MKNRPDALKIYLTVFFVVYTAYSALFIYKSSEVVSGKRYFILFDDMMISMRYAKNLAEGNGLTWNPGGEKVEGYSNFLWTVYMAVPHLLKYPASKTSFFIQLSGLMFMLLAMIMVFKTAMLMTENNPVISAGAVFLCGLYYTLTQWALIGTEVSVLAFLYVTAAYFFVSGLKEGRFRPEAYAVLAVMVLIRFDMVFTACLTALFLVFTDRDRAKQHLLYGLPAVLAAAAAMTVFRTVYYHDLLPNTYYLKMTGYPAVLRVARGLWSFTGMIARGGILPFVLPLAAVFFIKEKAYRLVVFMFCAQSLYSVYVGGDAWHNGVGANRFISAILPVFFIAVSMSVYRILAFIRERRANAAVFFTAILSLVFLLNSFSGMYSLRQSCLLEPALDQETGKRLLVEAYLINHVTDKDAVVGVFMAGITPYFAGRQCVDFLGKNDAHISRVKMQQPPKDAKLLDKIRFFYPGHLKTDFYYCIEQKMPDMFQGYQGEGSAVDTTARKTGYRHLSNHMFFLKDSKMIKWNALQNIINGSGGALKFL